MRRGIIFEFGVLHKQYSCLYANAVNVLKELEKRGYCFSVICHCHENNKKERSTQIGNSGISELFKSVQIGSRIYAEHYKLCMKSMNSAPQDTFIVDHNERRLIEMCEELLCNGFLLSKSSQENHASEEKNSILVIPSLSDLLTKLL